jgi:hypothetical protein
MKTMTKHAPNGAGEFEDDQRVKAANVVRGLLEAARPGCVNPDSSNNNGNDC